MQKEKFPRPYEITVEDKEVQKGKRADITLGFLEDKLKRFVVVELKHFPDDVSITEDLTKLHEFVKTHTIHGFFGMIGSSKYGYRQKINLKRLGIGEDEYSTIIGAVSNIDT